MIAMTETITARKQKIYEIDAGILSLLDKRMKLMIEIKELNKSSTEELKKLSLEVEMLMIHLSNESASELETQAQAIERIHMIWGKMFELEQQIAEV